MKNIEITNEILKNLDVCIDSDGNIDLNKFTELTNNLNKTINYTRCCEPNGHCKITVLVTYWEWQESGHVMLDDTKNKTTEIVEVEKLTDINEIFTNLIDVKILK